jgi:imidazole glycerol-phosphate synthase subunit HisF
MLSIRVIPTLLLRDQGLVKTVRFKDPKYVGDPINAVRIFNEKEVDELIFLDTRATIERRRPNFKLAADIATECFMPFGYGGGIRDLDDIKLLLSHGAEKIIINSYAVEDREFVRKAANEFGSQSIVVSVDVKKSLFGKYKIYTHGGTKATGHDPVTFSKAMEEMGAGEIILTAIDRDGTMEGYDVELLRKVTDVLTIPVVASGGAGRIDHFRSAVVEGGVSAVSAGSMFVFQGKYRAVLISYPSAAELEEVADGRASDE